MKIIAASIACAQGLDLATMMLLGGNNGGMGGLNAIGTNPFYQAQMVDKIPDTPTSTLMKHQYVAQQQGVDPNSAGVLASWAIDQGKDVNTVLANSMMAQQTGINPALFLTNDKATENLPLMMAMGGNAQNNPLAMAALMGNDIDPITMMAMQGQGGLNNPMALMALSGDNSDPLALMAASGQGLGDIMQNPLAMMALTGDSADSKKLLPFMLSGGNMANNPLALLALGGDGLDTSDPVTLMALSGGNLDMSNPLMLMSMLDGDNTKLKEMLPFMAMNGANGLDKNLLPFILQKEGKDDLLQTLILSGAMDGAGIDASALSMLSLLGDSSDSSTGSLPAK